MKTIVMVINAIILFSGCSVKMAAQKEGTTTQELRGCATDGCLQAKGCILLGTRETEEGIIKTYKFIQKRGSTARAVMHGILDVATLGLWEVAGTPIEGAQEKKFAVIDVLMNEQGVIKRIMASE